jgi:hypothetical protein
MNERLEEKVSEAIVSELRRQSGVSRLKLQIETKEDRLRVNGEIDLQALATAIVGAVSGGP